jgi:hypothetical protein
MGLNIPPLTQFQLMELSKGDVADNNPDPQSRQMYLAPKLKPNSFGWSIPLVGTYADSKGICHIQPPTQRDWGHLEPSRDQFISRED